MTTSGTTRGAANRQGCLSGIGGCPGYAELLTLTKSDAELIDVFKAPGQHTVGQDWIHEVLIERARAGKEGVRLKGGDPVIYGRGWEEIEACRLAGRPW